MTPTTMFSSTPETTAPIQATTSSMGAWDFGTAPAAASTKRDLYAVKYDKLEGRVIPDAGLYYEKVSSKITCLSYCAPDPECMSFFYIKATQSCILHTIVYISQNDTVRSDSASYYIVGDKNKCPIDKGFFHKRSLNACYYVVTDGANLTAQCVLAARRMHSSGTHFLLTCMIISMMLSPDHSYSESVHFGQALCVKMVIQIISSIRIIPHRTFQDGKSQSLLDICV